jgi:putative sporulation protein YtaF
MNVANFILIIMMSISSNTDNITVGFAYGARGVSIPLLQNIFIATVTSAGTYISMIVGKDIGVFIGGDVCAVLAGLLWIAVGVVVFVQELEKSKIVNNENIIKAPKYFFCKRLSDNVGNFHGCVGVFETFVLSVSLTLNNLFNGISAGAIGLNVVMATIFVFSISILTIIFGLFLGKKLRAFWLYRNIGILSAVFLICMGVCGIIFK